MKPVLFSCIPNILLFTEDSENLTPVASTPSSSTTTASAWTPKDILKRLNISDMDIIDLERASHSVEHVQHPDFSRAQPIVENPIFKEWMGRPQSAELLVHGDFDDLYTKADPFPVVCEALLATYRRSVIGLVFFCGYHSEWQIKSVGTLMIRSLLAQLLQACPPTITPMGHITMQNIEDDINNGETNSLCKLFHQVIQHMPPETTVVCLIDSIYQYEEVQWLDELENVLELLCFIVKANKWVVFKLLLLNAQPTKEVIKVFEGRPGVLLELPLVASIIPGLTPREAVADTFYRCLFGLDTNEPAIFASAFLKNSDTAIFAGPVELRGWKEISASFEWIFKITTTHISSNVRVDVKDESTALLTAHVVAHHVKEDDAEEDDVNEDNAKAEDASKTEVVMKGGDTTKAEVVTKVEVISKVEVTTKAEVTTKVEVTTKKEDTTKEEDATKVENTTKAEDAIKAENTIKKEDALKVEDSTYTAGLLYWIDLVRVEGEWKITRWKMKVLWEKGDKRNLDK